MKTRVIVTYYHPKNAWKKDYDVEFAENIKVTVQVIKR